MKNLGHTKNLGSFQYGAGKEGKTLGVVRVVAGWGTVKRLAFKKWRIIDKVETYAGEFAGADHRTKAVTVVEWDGDAADDDLGAL